MDQPRGPVLNIKDAEDHEASDGRYWGGSYKVLTPFMEGRGSLGANLSRLPPGRVGCPFHYHLLEDEVFYVFSGKGVLRYGEELFPIGPGDCISCPAGSKVAHQIANTGDDDLVYLGVGRNDPNEVCVYPDSGKVMVRGLKTVGMLEKTDYMAGEPEPPKVLEMGANAAVSGKAGDTPGGAGT